MANRPSWKVLTVGAAIAGLGIGGTGNAIADNGANPHDVQPIKVSTSAPADAEDNSDDHPTGDQASSTNSDQDSPDNTPDSDQDSPDNSPDDDNDSPDDQDSPDHDSPDNSPDHD